MRRITLAVLLLGLMASPLIQAQTAGKGGNRQPGTSAKGVSLVGQLSKDGKTLMAEDDNIWTVLNASLLKGFEGRHITVKCRMDLDKRAIHILDVLEPSKGYYSNNLKDSAFRR